jgi:DNA-binding CsgD family transcriptional regulator
MSRRPPASRRAKVGVGASPNCAAGRHDTDGRISDAACVSSQRDNRHDRVAPTGGSIQAAGEPGRVVVLAPQTASGSRRSWIAPSHSRSRSTLAGSAPAAPLARFSSSSGAGVPRPASRPPSGRRRVPVASSRSAGPGDTIAWPQTGVEPATEHLPISEPLSPAETRVLRYLPTLLSLREIGDELYLSVNTIKVHVRHIYVKLEVHSRRGAVERAGALGLL